MEKSKRELEAEILVLSNRLEESERKNKSLIEGLYYYVDVDAKWDRGIMARRAFLNSKNPKYKPINSVIAQIFKDKKINWLGPNEEMDGFENYISNSISHNDSDS